MAFIVDFLLPRRPLSHQAKDAAHKEEWKNFIFGRAFAEWQQRPITDGPLCFTLVHLCEEDPPDINNIIKPIQDALNSLVYSDDSLIHDVKGHMRLLSEPIDIVGLPTKLADAVIEGVECVYIQIANANALNVEVQT